METAKIIFFRDLLFRTFIVGLLFAILFGALTIVLLNTLLPWVAGLFEVDQMEIRKLIMRPTLISAPICMMSSLWLTARMER